MPNFIVYIESEGSSWVDGIKPTWHSAPRLSPAAASGRLLLLYAAALDATPT